MLFVTQHKNYVIFGQNYLNLQKQLKTLKNVIPIRTYFNQSSYLIRVVSSLCVHFWDLKTLIRGKRLELLYIKKVQNQLQQFAGSRSLKIDCL